MTRMDWLRIALAPLAAVVLLAYAPSTLADEPGEEAMPEAAAAEPAQEDEQDEAVVAPGGIEEITVTARKREESVQDIPIAITAFSGDDLDNININDVMDLQFNVPNVNFTKTNFSGSGSLAIRGIGRSVTAASGDAGTGTHVNGIPITAARIFETEFYDAERVEVLRGPQGTLYGRNSSAGSLNMISRKPTDEYSGYLEGEYGEYNHYKLKGALNVPLGERLALRVAGMYLDRDGYTRNQHTGNWIDDRELWGLRATLAADLGENTDATLTMSWFDEDDNRARLQEAVLQANGRALSAQPRLLRHRARQRCDRRHSVAAVSVWAPDVLQPDHRWVSAQPGCRRTRLSRVSPLFLVGGRGRQPPRSVCELRKSEG